MPITPFMVRNRRFTPIQQLQFLRASYKSYRWCTRPSGFSWWLKTTPTPISDEYILKVKYDQGKYPEVYIVYPKPLQMAEGAQILPHTFNTKSQHICLYMAKNHEWNESMLISETIVHWAIEWLYYYEHWAFTGKWLGGGHGYWDVEPKQQ